MTHKWGRMATSPKLGDLQLSNREERPHGETSHSMRVYVPSPNCPYPWSSGARNLGGKIRGSQGDGVCGHSGQNGLNSPKSGPSKYRISVSQEKGASGFCMDANRSFASLLRQGLRFKA